MNWAAGGQQRGAQWDPATRLAAAVASEPLATHFICPRPTYQLHSPPINFLPPFRPVPRLQRNYRYFLLFVSSTSLLCIWVIAFCVANLVLAARDAGWSLTSAVSDHPAALVCAVYTFLGFWFVGGLTVFHSYLVATNQTTYEHFRHRYSGGGPWGLEGDGESSGRLGGLRGWVAGWLRVSCCLSQMPGASIAARGVTMHAAASFSA